MRYRLSESASKTLNPASAAVRLRGAQIHFEKGGALTQSKDSRKALCLMSGNLMRTDCKICGLVHWINSD